MQYLRAEYAYKARKNEQNVRLRKEKCRCASECNKIEGFLHLFTSSFQLLDLSETNVFQEQWHRKISDSFYQSNC